MSYTRNKSWYLVIGLMLAVLSGIMLVRVYAGRQVRKGADSAIGIRPSRIHGFTLSP